MSEPSISDWAREKATMFMGAFPTIYDKAKYEKQRDQLARMIDADRAAARQEWNRGDLLPPYVLESADAALRSYPRGVGEGEYKQQLTDLVVEGIRQYAKRSSASLRAQTEDTKRLEEIRSLVWQMTAPPIYNDLSWDVQAFIKKLLDITSDAAMSQTSGEEKGKSL